MKQKNLIILIILLFIVSISTYAIYRVRGNVGVNLSTAKWNVKVKDKELKTAGTVDLNFTKDDIVWEPNPKVKAGTVAPGSKGTITFNVDATGTEVSTYVIVDVSSTSYNENFIIKEDNGYTFISVNDPNKVKPITINIEWLKKDDYDSNWDDREDINKTLSINVKVMVKQSLGLRLLKTAILEDNGGINAIKTKKIKDFSKITPTNTKEGMFMAEDDYGESYYYRGEADNWVSFAGFYWRIVRINGDGSIRLIYSGTKYNNFWTGASIGESVYNYNRNNEKYADYKISAVKTMVDNWYKTAIIDNGYDKKIADAGLCNDMTKYNDEEFSSYNRLFVNKTPTLKCPDKDHDLLSRGNSKLTYPVGLLTHDEAVFAGGRYYNKEGDPNEPYYEDNYYLDVGMTYWTMTPAYWTGYFVSVGSVHHATELYNDEVDYERNDVRPVLSLKPDVTTISGNGTLEEPYVIN